MEIDYELFIYGVEMYKFCLKLISRIFISILKNIRAEKDDLPNLT